MKSAPVLLTLSDSKHVVLPVDDDSDLNVVAAFDRRGEFIYTGNAKGKVRQHFVHGAPRKYAIVFLISNSNSFYRMKINSFKLYILNLKMSCDRLTDSSRCQGR